MKKPVTIVDGFDGNMAGKLIIQPGRRTSKTTFRAFLVWLQKRIDCMHTDRFYAGKAPEASANKRAHRPYIRHNMNGAL
jgi:hypothetical protein